MSATCSYTKVSLGVLYNDVSTTIREVATLDGAQSGSYSILGDVLHIDMLLGTRCHRETSKSHNAI